ncbi:50S ribosomal protein L24 [Candidatus Pacearchaeota archaeon]|jgi:large subunit ribosomal protein L24|nr:50S ribosomal protein L24 [Candidatus Pacearchaeota archaeon]
MKKEFSTAWKGSKQPRKQRKYAAKAPLHIKRKLLSINLSKELRKKIGKRNVVVRKGDNVKVMTGKFKGKTGKIIQVFTKKSKITMEGIQVKKQDGSKANIKLQPSNLQIIELNLEDKKRIQEKKSESKKEIKQENKK